MSGNNNELRVCTYNIHKGFCATNRRSILQDLRHAIRTVDADLVFLQEVVGERLDRLDGNNQQQGNQNDYPQFEYRRMKSGRIMLTDAMQSIRKAIMEMLF